MVSGEDRFDHRACADDAHDLAVASRQGAQVIERDLNPFGVGGARVARLQHQPVDVAERGSEKGRGARSASRVDPDASGEERAQVVARPCDLRLRDDAVMVAIDSR